MNYYCYKKFILKKYQICPFCKKNINIINSTSINEIKNNINSTFNTSIFKYEINKLYYK